MIAANIGKTFLQAYNEKYKCAFTAKEFFVEKFFRLFFDEEKYMQWVTNSPFVQGIKKGVYPTPEERQLKLEVLVNKIAENDADASIAIGFPSLDLLATTSGQVSNLALPLDKEDVYLSWIGGGFGIGVKGGLSIFFNQKQILLDLFEGWEIYRSYLNATPKLRGNQINTWNGQWISHRYDKRTYNASHPTASFNPFAATSDGGLEVSTQSWMKVLLGIARNYPDTLLTGYVYSLGQTNITIGFIPFNLPKIREPYDLYTKYFGANDMVEQLFGTEIGFTQACQAGSIGINALEPKGFRDCLRKGLIPTYSEKDEKKRTNFNTYQIWLLAMLNNEDLVEKTRRFAEVLHAYAMSDKNARTKKSQAVNNLIKSVKRELFVEELAKLVESPDDALLLDEIGQFVMLMPVEKVPHFLTYLRFQYAIVSKTK